jgi:hypothetical protein
LADGMVGSSVGNVLIFLAASAATFGRTYSQSEAWKRIFNKK